MRKLHIKEPAISFMLGIKSVTGEVNPSTGTPAHNKNVKVSTGAQVERVCRTVCTMRRDVCLMFFLAEY